MRSRKREEQVPPACAQRTWATWRGSRKTSTSGAQRGRGAVLRDEVGELAEAVLCWSEREFGFTVSHWEAIIRVLSGFVLKNSASLLCEKEIRFHRQLIEIVWGRG